MFGDLGFVRTTEPETGVVPMDLTALPKSVLRLQYRVARFPLGVIERQLRFLPSDAMPRLMYERGLGMLDGIVGSVVGDEDIATRGALTNERAQAVLRAEELDRRAATEKQAADAQLRNAHERAADEREEARTKREQEVEQARTERAEREKRAAQEAAQKKAAQTAQATRQAEKQRQSAEATKRKQQAAVREAEKQASEPAKITLEDAVAKKLESKKAEEHAKKAGNLADAEKASRKS